MDKGRGEISGIDYENGKFKVPSLRNIALTAPYMHDGRFENLEEVIAHYNKGGASGLNVSPTVRKLGLSPADVQDLIAFLHTLTDKKLIYDERFSDPFKK